MKIREQYTCPLELTHDMIKGKWKPIILWRLRLGETSLSQLEKDINGITQKMLEALSIMQQLGIDFMLSNGMEDVLREKGVIL